ncbi:MAG: hypothetical protein WBO57_04045 [Gammaproteobacteria bacterium]
MIEKLKNRSIWLIGGRQDPALTKSAAALLRDVKGVMRVRIMAPNRMIVSYNVRQITMQTIEDLLNEFGYRLNPGFYCRFLRSFCNYLEDIECNEGRHDQADCTRDAFITRYLRRPHGCRDQRPHYLRRYL